MSNETKITVFEHLDELRKRLIYSAITLMVGFAVCFTYSEQLLALLRLPLDHQIRLSFTTPIFEFIKSATPVTLIFISPAEAFWAHLKIAIVAAIIFSCPVIITEVWLFIKPALYKDERRTVAPFIIFSILLFIVGLAFCTLIVLPFALDFLLNYKTAGITAMLTLERYIDFMLKFILAFGAIFQTPIIILVLIKLNIITTETLKKNRKYAVLVAFIVAAVLTPTPDIFNQCLMALPLMLLYEISIIFANIFYREKEHEK